MAMGLWNNYLTKDRAVIKSLILLSAFIIAGKLVSGYKEVLVAWSFGATPELDCIAFIFALVNWPVAICSSVLPSIVIPLARLSEETEYGGRIFRRELQGIILMIGSIGALASFILIPTFLKNHALQVGPASIGGTIAIVALSVSLIPLGLLCALYSTWTMQAGRHSNTLFEAIPALAVIIGITIVPSGLSLVLATVVGTGLQLIVVSVPFIRKREYREFTIRLQSPLWRSAGRGLLIILVAQSIMGVTTLIDQWMAAGIGPGAVSSLGYASRFTGIVLAILATAASRAILPALTKLRAVQESEQHIAASTAQRWALASLLVGIMITAVGWTLAPLLVNGILKRGEFSESAATSVILLVRVSILQTPFYLASICAGAFFTSISSYGTLLATALIAVGIKAAVGPILVAKIGLLGIAVSTVASYFVNAAFLLLKLRTYNREKPYKQRILG